MTVPQTRDEAIALLQKLGWDTDELSPDERDAVRRLYGLDPIPIRDVGARYLIPGIGDK